MNGAVGHLRSEPTMQYLQLEPMVLFCVLASARFGLIQVCGAGTDLHLKQKSDSCLACSIA